jgi:hypothetical protein
MDALIQIVAGDLADLSVSELLQLHLGLNAFHAYFPALSLHVWLKASDPAKRWPCSFHLLWHNWGLEVSQADVSFAADL